jgi:hypothetical protein
MHICYKYLLPLFLYSGSYVNNKQNITDMVLSNFFKLDFFSVANAFISK